MADRGLALAVGAGIAALAAGVLAVIVAEPVLGVVSGIAGVVAAGAAATISARARQAEARFDSADTERRQLRREVEALAMLLEDTSMTDAADKAGPGTTAPEHTFDPDTGLYDQAYFAVLAQQQVAAARRSLRPVSVVLFEIDGMDGADDQAKREAMAVVGSVVARTLRESDAACRLGDVMIGAILEDTPEVGGVWAAERIRGALLATPAGDSITLSAGVSCYPTHALGAAELVGAAGRALEEAQLGGADRVEVAPET